MKPGTREEAIPWILSQLSEKQKAEIRSMSLAEFLCQGHLGLGMMIRNELFYGNPQRERLEASLVEGDLGLHPDELSQKLLEDVWKELMEKER